MNIFGLFLITWLIIPLAIAGVAPFEYRIGKISVGENDQQIIIHSTPPVLVSVLPGGRTWPLMFLDEAGTIYVGNNVIDAATGRAKQHSKELLALPQNVGISDTTTGFQIRREGKRCSLSLQQLGLGKQRSPRDAVKNANIVFSSATAAFLALVTQFGEDGKISGYLVEKIDVDRCEIVSRARLGNPDLLVELGHTTEGGWWIAGSIEQTLLRSPDGAHWSKVKLPVGLSGLTSAYVLNAREIWLAASLTANDTQSPYLLVYSDDAGTTWRNIATDDPALSRLPRGWLEGQKRRTP